MVEDVEKGLQAVIAEPPDAIDDQRRVRERQAARRPDKPKAGDFKGHPRHPHARFTIDGGVALGIAPPAVRIGKDLGAGDRRSRKSEGHRAVKRHRRIDFGIRGGRSDLAGRFSPLRHGVEIDGVLREAHSLKKIELMGSGDQPVDQARTRFPARGGHVHCS